MDKLKSKVESLLFINNQPFSVKKLIDLTKAEKKQIETAVDELIKEYKENNGGIVIQRAGELIQMTTSADNTKLIQDFIKAETTGELTKASLETLTIVAYRGPVSRAELEQIRGVNCSVILRNLAMRGLISFVQDKKKMQTLYSVTLDFLKFLGLNEQSELPDYEKLNSSEAIQKILEDDLEENKEEKK